MHVRRIACLLLGIWLGGSFFMGAVAALNFYTVDRLLEEPTPPLAEMVKRVGGGAPMRLLLRYQAAEENRLYFDWWELVQLVLGLGLFGLLLFGTEEGRWPLALSFAMVLLAAVMHWAITPGIVGLGRELDFVAPDALAGLRRQFGSRHMAYTVLEGSKVVLGGLLALALIRFQGRRRNSHQEFLNETMAATRPTR